MSWFAFALLCLLGWGFADLFYKLGSDENDRYSHLKIAVWVGLVMGVCALVMLPFSESFAPGRQAVNEKGTYVYENGALTLTSESGSVFAAEEEDGEYLISYVFEDDEDASLDAETRAAWEACRRPPPACTPYRRGRGKATWGRLFPGMSRSPA